MLTKANKVTYLHKHVHNLASRYTPRLQHDTHSVLSRLTWWLLCTTTLTTEALQFACYLLLRTFLGVSSDFFLPYINGLTFVMEDAVFVARN
jgi:hypothetical protein